MNTRLIACGFSAGLLAVLVLEGANDASGQGKTAGQSKAPGAGIVKKILSVDVTVQTSEPPNLVVTTVGQVPTAGYSKIKLVRVIYDTPPDDGVQDYFFLAVPPSGPAAQVITDHKASNTWKGYTNDAPWLKGVRVHGVDDGVVVKLLTNSK